MINACTSSAESLHRDASSNRSSRPACHVPRGQQPLTFDSPLGLGSRPFTIIHSRSRSFTIINNKNSERSEEPSSFPERAAVESQKCRPCRSFVRPTVKKHTHTA